MTYEETSAYPDPPKVPTPLGTDLLLEMEDRLNYDRLGRWQRLTTKPPPGAGARIDIVYEFFAVFFKTLLVATVALGLTWLLWGLSWIASALMILGSVIVIYVAAGRPFWGCW